MRTTLATTFLLLLIFAVAPIVIVVFDSFVSGDGGLTFEHYAAAFGHPRRFGLLVTSLLIATGATIVSLAIGLPYAFFCTRIRTPLRSVFSALYILPLVLPPLLLIMGWDWFLVSLKDPDETGLGLSRYLGGIPGVALILGLAHFPFIVLFARSAFLSIGAGLEEAARMTRSPLAAFARITLRLALPSIMAGALFVFLFSIADFSVTDYVSIVAGTEGTVKAYPFEAFQVYGTNFDAQLGRREGEALGLPLAAICIGLLLTIIWLIRKGRYVTVTSGHVRPRDVEEKSPPATRFALRSFGFVYLTSVLLVSVFVPLGRIFLTARGKEGDIIGSFRYTLMEPGYAAGDVGRSLALSGAAGIIMVLIAAVLAHHMVRRGRRREALVMSLAFLPLAFGPIMYGAGLIRMWNQPWLETAGGVNPIYDKAWLPIFMLVGKYLPFALAAVAATVRRVDPGYEEVAAVSGAGWGRRMLSVVTPLTASGLVGGFVLGFVFSMRELDTMAMLTGGNQTVILRIYRWVHFAHYMKVASLSLILVLLIALPFLLYVLFLSRRIRVL